MTRVWLILCVATGCTTTAVDPEPEPGPGPDTGAPQQTGDTGAISRPECPDGLCLVEGPILEDTTFRAGNAYLLRGTVVVGNGTDPVTLTIEPGTTVLGEVDTKGLLVVARRADLVADGTRDSPIVMTSSNPAGSRARGDWGGLVVNGRARVNRTPSPRRETGTYGGATDDDDSGVLRYVRIEFAGTELQPDEPLPGLQLNAVGSQTTIDHVQIHRSNGDGIGLTGGTVNLKHAVISQTTDDGLDWSEGWTGKAQWVVVQSPQGEEASSRGIEGGNLAIDPTAGPPTSDPVLANVTLVGDLATPRSPVGLFLRQGTQGEVWSALVSNFPGACLDIDDVATWDGVETGAIDIRGSRFACSTLAVVDDQDLTDNGVFDPADPLDLLAWLADAARGNVSAPTVAWLGDPTSVESPTFGSSETVAATGPSDPFFEETDIVGAVGRDDWTAGWTAYPAQ